MKENFEDRYEIIETIAGAGSIVYKALDKSFDRIVAIKTLDDRALASPVKVERFVKEGHLLAKFDHPNIITAYHFHEIDEFDHRCYLVCPWLESSLDLILDKENLSTAAVCDIFMKVLEGVRALHNEGIVHRDLKPGNIFLSRDRQQVKIGDLGIASNIENDQTLDPESLTPKYHAPEVLDESQKIGRRADVYSLGMIFYEMLLGRQRFESAFPEVYQDQDLAAGTNMRWMNWHQDEDRQAKPLDEIAGEIAPRISEIVQKMLNKSVAQRYGDVDSVINDLREHLGAGVSSLPYAAIDSVTELPKVPFHKRKIFYVLMVVLSLLLIFFVYVVFIKKSPAELRALDAEAAMNKVRETAISFGLDEEGYSEKFVVAEVDRGEGYTAKKSRKYKLAAEEFTQSRDEFVASIDIEFTNIATNAEATKRNAESLGAADFESYISGVDNLAQGKKLVEEDAYKDAFAALNLALSNFRQAYAVGLNQEVGRLAEQIKELGVDTEGELFTSAMQLRESGEVQIQGGDYVTAIDSLTQARSKLLELIDFSMKPRLAKLGSSSEQIELAYALCNEHSDNCKREWYASETYQEILLKPFKLDSHEVTNGDFLKFVVATDYVTDAENLGFSYRVIAGKLANINGLTWSSNFEEISASEDVSDKPVVNVSFNDAKAYCKYVGKRLPSAAEWEYAARGFNAGTVFPWGDEWNPNNVIWGSGGRESPVSVQSGIGSDEGNEYAHLVGNVWEWTSTSFDDGYLLKGGSWAEANPANLRPAAATSFPANQASDDFGFRCASTQDVW